MVYYRRSSCRRRRLPPDLERARTMYGRMFGRQLRSLRLHGAMQRAYYTSLAPFTRIRYGVHFRWSRRWVSHIALSYKRKRLDFWINIPRDVFLFGQAATSERLNVRFNQRMRGHPLVSAFCDFTRPLHPGLGGDAGADRKAWHTWGRESG